jgi:2-polyprenyl-6-methoxyphenol hydroxylase-like FAD-dependent oxidoreductase
MGQHGSSAGRVLVVGAGIAGLAMARALQQHDVPVEVVERTSELPLAGLALNLPGNAVRALRDLGVGEDLGRRGVPVQRREYRNARGRLLFAVDEAAFWGSDLSRCLHRGDLLELLLGSVRPDAVRWGSRVDSLRASAERVEVRMDGDRSEGYDFVVGADGVHSTVRTFLPGMRAPRPALLSAASWRFMTANPGVDCWSVWSGSAGTLLLIPVDDDQVYGYGSATQGGPVESDPQWLRQTFGDYPGPVCRAVTSALADPPMLYHSPVEEVRLERWHHHRVVLIGDAAHATAPVWAQGAALAAEDALVLAELLATSDDWSTVGEDYERRRRPRVEHVQKMTDRLSRTVRIPGRLRDAILPVVGPRTYRETYGPLRDPVTTNPG